MKKMLKWAAIMAVVALVVGTFVYLYIKSRPQEVVYELNEVQIKDLEKTTIVTGKIEPRDEVNIKPQISGIITELYKEAGEMVKKD
ncbi:MAG: efflux RND transporter periplasmic adaptor subunit, partial [Bacteroidaceae bacterium]|nr:efflux RND transporter periplasmic adaptor subunit [Bacteroidaceae bacterium]